MGSLRLLVPSWRIGGSWSTFRTGSSRDRFVCRGRGFRGVCRTGSARFQKYSRFPGLMRFSGKMFGWTAGFSAPNLEDLHEDVQVFDSKAILGRFAGGLSGIGSFGFLRQALAINWLELGFVFA